MVDSDSLLAPGESLVILGSLNAKPQDRKLKRSEVRPVQVVLDGEVRTAPFFDSWGELGVSSIAWRPQSPRSLYIASDDDANGDSGTILSKLDLDSREVKRLQIPDLKDVHEMFVVGEELWISNTGCDEAVSFDLDTESVSRRVNLSTTSLDGDFEDSTQNDDESVDTFHCNEVFEGHDGDLYALVHHVSGRQRFEEGVSRRLKRQGDGGVINLRSRRAYPLDLKAPHSARRIGEGYWILDSGRFAINIYDGDWRLRERISSRGWGRGADVSASRGVFYVGTSEIRRRYKDRLPFARPSSNAVRCIDLHSRQLVGEIPLSDLGEVNSVYVVPEEISRALSFL